MIKVLGFSNIRAMPGNIVNLEVNLAYDVNETMCTQVKYFRRLFWTFHPCVQGFAFYKPIVQKDGTYLFGMYNWSLLIGVTQDGNNNVFHGFRPSRVSE